MISCDVGTPQLSVYQSIAANALMNIFALLFNTLSPLLVSRLADIVAVLALLADSSVHLSGMVL